MSRRIILFIFMAGLTATFLFKPQMKSNKVLGMANFTVITRTSTPEPQPPTPIPPTATQSSGGGGNPNPTTAPTATDIPNTATPTLVPVTLVATPVGGFIPTAVSCSSSPTVQAKNTTRVRSGPGTDYDIIGQLVYLETRPIVGRAANATWWVIQFANNEIGWVSNAVVNVDGNTSGIPLVGAPPINGEEPTPEPLWEPTPNPDCPITPTATPSSTAKPTKTPVNTPTVAATDTKTPQPSQTATTERIDTESASIIDEAEASPTTTAVKTTPTTTATSVVPSGAENGVASTEIIQATAVPLTDADAQKAASALPCAPALIGLAVIGFLAFRRIF